MKRNGSFFLEKSVQLKKLCLMYLINRKKKNLGLSNGWEAHGVTNIEIDSTKNIEFKDFSKNKHLYSDLFEFFFFFHMLFESLIEKKDVFKTENNFFQKFKRELHLKSIIEKKKNVYFIKNFKKSKEKNLFWFYETKKNISLHKIKKNIEKYNLFNVKVLLNIVSKELRKNSLLGFSKKSVDLIVKVLKKTIKKIIIEIRNISIKRKLGKKKAINEWGLNNIIWKKNRPFHDFDFNFLDKMKVCLRKYKSKKSTSCSSTSQTYFQVRNLSNTNDNLSETKKNTESNDNLLRANKTLMTLLNEILQIRMEELRKETTCLCKYKPVEIENSPKKEENIKENGGKKEKLKKKKTDKTKHGIYNAKGMLPFVSDSYQFLSGIDCFLYLKNTKSYHNQILSFTLLLLLMSDFNSRFKLKKQQ